MYQLHDNPSLSRIDGSYFLQDSEASEVLTPQGVPLPVLSPTPFASFDLLIDRNSSCQMYTKQSVFDYNRFSPNWREETSGLPQDHIYYRHV